MKNWLRLIVILVLAVLAASCGGAGATLPPGTVTPSQTPSTTPPATNPPSATPPFTVIFDFDSGSPPLSARQYNTPFDQTSSGLTAHFSSPADPAAFSVQSHDTTFLVLSLFSGNYLYENNPFRNSLEIRFSQPLTGITLVFATTDSHGPGNVEEPSNIKLTAYLDSPANQVGSSTARGSFSGDSFPMGSLSLNSAERFNLVVIELIPQPRGGTNFLVDNISVSL